MTLASGTRAGNGVEREEIGAVLLLGIDLTRVVPVVSEAACIVVQARSTVLARFSPSGGNSRWGPLREANSLSSSLIRPISTVPNEVLS